VLYRMFARPFNAFLRWYMRRLEGVTLMTRNKREHRALVEKNRAHDAYVMWKHPILMEGREAYSREENPDLWEWVDAANKVRRADPNERTPAQINRK